MADISYIKKYIEENISDEFELNEKIIQEWDDFIYFNIRPKTNSMYGGGVLYFLQKQTGRIFQQPLYLSIEEALSAVRKIARTEEFLMEHIPNFSVDKKFCLTITLINNLTQVVETFISHGVKYIIPEAVAGNIYRISVNYKRNKLKERLEQLPTTFHLIPDLYSLASQLIHDKSCEFILDEYTQPSGAKYTDNATDEDYEPIW